MVNWPKFLPLVVLSLVAFASKQSLSAWGFMWIMGLSIYAGCKWITWCRAVEGGMKPGPWLSFGYLVLWLGMDGREFLSLKTKIRTPPKRLWYMAFIKTVSGAALLWIVPRLIPPAQTWFVGYVGVLGLMLLVFFGIFHFFALLWQQVGVSARHIMNSPLRATSPSDFWSRRWNLAVHKLADELVFKPSVRRLGVAGATFMTFLVSGLSHELITSLPAGAGYGLPTLYFALQSLGVLVQKSRLGKRLSLGRGPIGWFFTFLFVLCPSFLLFHPPFITNVIIPFMEKIRAL